jgi:hypothetical protein
MSFVATLYRIGVILIAEGFHTSGFRSMSQTFETSQIFAFLGWTAFTKLHCLLRDHNLSQNREPESSLISLACKT